MHLSHSDTATGWIEPRRYARAAVGITVADVEAEAARRLQRLRVGEWRTREFITGRSMPHGVVHTALQIDFAAKAIVRLSPIPKDFADDVYWPRQWDEEG